MIDISEKVKQIIVDKLAVDIESVTLEANLKEDLGADSIDLIELVMAFEDEFKITVPDDTFEGIVTVQQAIDCVNDRAANKK